MAKEYNGLTIENPCDNEMCGCTDTYYYSIGKCVNGWTVLEEREACVFQTTIKTFPWDDHEEALILIDELKKIQKG